MKVALEYIERNVAWLIFTGFALMIVAPIFIVSWSLCAKCDFTKSGPIGDTIGGITAPIVNLLGALLVYFAFNAQNKANKTQAEALTSQVEANQILKEEIDRANFFSTYNEITQLLELTHTQFEKIRYNAKTGSDAFDSWLSDSHPKNLSEKANKSFLKECSFVLELIDKTTKSIEGFFDVNDAGQEIPAFNQNRSNSQFNFKNLLRIKFQHNYQLYYKATIICLKDFTEAKAIRGIYSDNDKFEEFLKESADSSTYYQFRKILIAANNIEITLKESNKKYWGESPNKK